VRIEFVLVPLLIEPL